MERNTPAPGVSANDHRRGLFPDNDPFASGWLSTGGPHEIFYEECGNPNGKPCVILHGGPGGAINPTMRRFFDPRKWRMALFDQRSSRSVSRKMPRRTRLSTRFGCLMA